MVVVAVLVAASAANERMNEVIARVSKSELGCNLSLLFTGDNSHASTILSG